MRQVWKKNRIGLLLILLVLVVGCTVPTVEVVDEVEESVAMETAVIDPTATKAATPTSEPEPTQTAVVTVEPEEETAVAAEPTVAPTPEPTPGPALVVGPSRGYLTTPEELEQIKAKADEGLEPYASAVEHVMRFADKDWDFDLDRKQNCKSADRPRWNDNDRGTAVLYGKAIAYHLTGDEQYAADVKDALEQIMVEVETIRLDEQQCRLNFGWGTPELVASADLIEAYWQDMTCSGPATTLYGDDDLIDDDCKRLFQNWLVKNPYYVVSYTAIDAQSNWGAAATTTTAYIADYLWDRPEVTLVHRAPEQFDDGRDILFTPSEAYAYANQLLFNRLNGYSIDYHSSKSCDFLGNEQQNSQWEPVKSQITPDGIIPEDSRREEYCNIPVYNGEYQNYPQLHLGNTLQQCELMLRRNDNRCYENIDNSDIPNFTFIDSKGNEQTTHLRPGRGSIERAIKAIIIDSGTVWQRESALAVALRYYSNNSRFLGIEYWHQQYEDDDDCNHDICFGRLTHGFAEGEAVGLPPIVAAP